MSVGVKEVDAEAGENGAGNLTTDPAPMKKARFDRCFTGLDVKIGKGPLKEMDSDRLKREIQRWAKAVVAYARQLSFKSPKTPKTPKTPKMPPSRSSSERESAELENEEVKSK